MKQLALVYGLYDELEPENIRYVGMTRGNRGVKGRIYYHKWASHHKNLQVPSARWIRKIGKERVGYVVIEEVPYLEAGESEKYWIAEYKRRGMANLNITEGGDGQTPEAMSGENNPNATLTKEDVRKIREAALAGYCKTSELADKYGVKTSAISKVLRNQIWYDPEYDPQKRVVISEVNSALREGELVWRTVPDEDVERIRSRYLSGLTVSELSKGWKQPQTSIRRLLFEKYGSEGTREKCQEEKNRRQKPVVNLENDHLR